MADTATAAAPEVGEVRTVGPETRRWDGHVWQLVPRTFLGGEDFTGRMKAYAKPVLGTMASDIAAPVLHPLDTIGSLAQTAMHLPTAADNFVTTGANALKGDPESAGHLLSLLAAPKAADLALSGTNAAAHAVADSAAARHGLGTIIGGGTAIATGMGHPFLGMAAGRVLAPLLKYPAEDIASATDWMKNAIHGAPAGTDALPTVPPALQKDYGDLVKSIGKEGADRWLARQTGTSPASAPPRPAPPVSRPIMNTAPEAADILTGETPEAWKARMQARLDAAKPKTPAGPTPVTPTGSSAPETSAALNSELARLRRSYGAQRVGTALRPDAPEVGNGAVTKADIAAGNSGVSSMPDVAWQPLKRDLMAGKSADPARTLRAVQQLLKEHARNAEHSTVPQRLAELLKDFTPESK